MAQKEREKCDKKRPAPTNADTDQDKGNKKAKTDVTVASMQAKIDAYTSKIEELDEEMYSLRHERKELSRYLDVINLHDLPECSLPWVMKRWCDVDITHRKRAGQSTYKVDVSVGNYTWYGTFGKDRLPSKSNMDIFEDQARVYFDSLNMQGHKIPNACGKRWDALVDAAVKSNAHVKDFFDIDNSVSEELWEKVCTLPDPVLEFIVCARSMLSLQLHLRGNPIWTWALQVSADGFKTNDNTRLYIDDDE